MAPKLALDLIRGDSTERIAVLDGESRTVGRDAEAAIRIEHTAISRIHGSFVPTRNHWVYQDLGSTNGSWINGRQIQGGQWGVLRVGDVLQLSDIAIKVLEAEGSPRLNERARQSIIVFSGESFVEEFPIPDVGRALMLGGAKGDVALSGYEGSEPALVVERLGEGVYAERTKDSPSAVINDLELVSKSPLFDRDTIRMNECTILYNDLISAGPPKSGPSANKIAREFEQPQGFAQGEKVADQPHRHNETRAHIFRPGTDFRSDKREGDADKTSAVDPAKVREMLSGFDKSPSTRGGFGGFESDEFSPTEKKLIAIIVILLLLTVLFLLSWWLFL